MWTEPSPRSLAGLEELGSLGLSLSWRYRDGDALARGGHVALRHDIPGPTLELGTSAVTVPVAAVHDFGSILTRSGCHASNLHEYGVAVKLILIFIDHCDEFGLGKV